MFEGSKVRHIQLEKKQTEVAPQVPSWCFILGTASRVTVAIKHEGFVSNRFAVRT